MTTTTPVVLDWDRDTWRCTTADGEMLEVSRSSVTDGSFLKTIRGSILVVEAPHLAPRTRKSKAQVMDADELAVFADAARMNGVTIKLWPHRLTRRASREAGIGSFEMLDSGKVQFVADKSRDTASIQAYISRHGKDMPTWSNAPRQLDDVVEAIREDVKDRINFARNYPEYSDDVANLEAALLKIVLERRPRDAAHLEFFGLRLPKTGSKTKLVKSGRKHPRAARAAWILTRASDGSPRVRPDGRFVGVAFLRDRVAALHEHGRGIVRSEVMWYSMGPFERAATGRRDMHWERETDEMIAQRRAARAEFRLHFNWMMRRFRDL